MKPEDFDAIDPGALKVNGLTKDQLQDAPEAGVVWKSFADWIQKYNTSKDKSFWGTPIPCGYNICGFDLVLFDRYCKKYKYWDEKQDRQTLFWPLNRFDVFDHMWLYMRTNSDIKRMKLISILEYCGIPLEEIEKGAHDAMWDVEMTAKLAVKLLKLAGRLTEVGATSGKRMMEIKDCLKEQA